LRERKDEVETEEHTMDAKISVAVVHILYSELGHVVSASMAADLANGVFVTVQDLSMLIMNELRISRR
jgi:hypothetical protein